MAQKSVFECDIKGESAYQVALNNGFVGSEQDWLDSLKSKGDPGDPGDPGPPGKPPQIASNGNWEYYDDDTDSWVDSGVQAQGPKGDIGNINYGTCDTSGSTVDKETTISGFNLILGIEISVKFDNANTVNSPTLNVSSTGAKPLEYMGYPVTNGMILDNHVAQFIYDGTSWVLLNPPESITVADESEAETLTVINPVAGYHYPDP